MLITGPLETQARVQLDALTGFDFQAVIELMLYSKHTEDGFLNIRQIKDEGADGIILQKATCR